MVRIILELRFLKEAIFLCEVTKPQSKMLVG